MFSAWNIALPYIRRGRVSTPFVQTVTYDGPIRYLEHVVIKMTIEVMGNVDEKNRGDIAVDLTSPNGLTAAVLKFRIRDRTSEGYNDWSFMSVMFWGEDPTGEWRVNVITATSATVARVSGVELTFYGVSTTPEAVANIPDECHSDCRRGCAGEGSNFCDSCVKLRNAYTLECVDECPSGYTERNGYCYDPNISVEECNSPMKIKEEGK